MAEDDPSLEQLENDFWQPSSPEDSHLVKTVHLLRSKTVSSLEVEDLRIMIGQEVGTEVLIPIALERLECEPLLEGDYYPGDLLVAVLRVKSEYWNGHPAELQAAERIVASINSCKPHIAEHIRDFRGRMGI